MTMFEHLDDPSPPRADDALRGRVLDAVDHRRRVRRIAAAGATGLAALVLVGVALAAGGSPNRRSLHVASPATSTSEPSSSDTGPGDTAAPPDATTTPTTGGGPGTTGAGSSGGRPVSHPVSSIPANGGTTTTSPSTATTAALGPCPADALTVTTTTDYSSYAAGQTVTVTVTVQNHGSQPCIRPEPGYREDTVTIIDHGGNVVWNPPGGPPGVGPYYPPTAVAPGESYTYSTTAWDQHTCDASCSASNSPGPGTPEGGQVPPGAYTALGHVSTDTQTLTSPSQQFTVQ